MFIALVCIVIINAAIWVALARKPHPHNNNRTKLARQEQLERSRKSITARVGSWVVDAMQSSYVRAVYVPLECTSPTYRSLGLYKNNNNDKG